MNLQDELTKMHLPLPNGAYFTAISVTDEYYNSIFEYWQLEVVVATTNFHSFQVNLHLDKQGTVVTHEIAKVYYRYGFYQSQNYIKSFDGYFALAQRLPTMFEPFEWYSPEVMVVYDTRDHWKFNEDGEKVKEVKYFEGTTIPVEFMLGGFPFHSKGDVRFDFNFTFTRNREDPLAHIGLLAVHTKQARIREFGVHEKFKIRLDEGIKHNQHARLRAQNDYHYLDIPLNVLVPGDHEGEDGLPGWGIALIVIGSVAVAAVVGYVVFIKFIKGGKRPYRESETEKSLLEKEGEFEEKDEDSGSGEEESSSGEEEGSEEEEEAEGSAEEAPKDEAPAAEEPAKEPEAEAKPEDEGVKSEPEEKPASEKSASVKSEEGGEGAQ